MYDTPTETHPSQEIQVTQVIRWCRERSSRFAPLFILLFDKQVNIENVTCVTLWLSYCVGKKKMLLVILSTFSFLS